MISSEFRLELAQLVALFFQEAGYEADVAHCSDGSESFNVILNGNTPISVHCVNNFWKYENVTVSFIPKCLKTSNPNLMGDSNEYANAVSRVKGLQVIGNSKLFASPSVNFCFYFLYGTYGNKPTDFSFGYLLSRKHFNAYFEKNQHKIGVHERRHEDDEGYGSCFLTVPFSDIAENYGFFFARNVDYGDDFLTDLYCYVESDV